ncbi:MAG: ankyrin repeat domain-containing protein [Myxococcales bacterium]|nr:ankyrin repeat domain-containing protein [Myxococcales bacterium]
MAMSKGLQTLKFAKETFCFGQLAKSNFCSEQKPIKTKILEWVKEEIKNGYDVNKKNEEGGTPLSIAVINDNEELTSVLLANKAEPNLMVNEGTTLLVLAIQERCSPRLINILLKAGADPSFSPFGLTPLMVASILGNKDALQELLSFEDLSCAHQLDINEKDANGKTALSLAIGTQIQNKYVRDLGELIQHENILDVIKGLIKWGADTNVKDKTGLTPLMKAALAGNIEIVQLLIGSGALLDEKDNFGNSALSLIIKTQINDEMNSNSVRDTLSPKKAYEMIEFLLMSRADVDNLDAEEATPLMFATLTKNADIVQLLLKFNPLINAVNSHSQTALDLAEDNEIVRILRENKAISLRNKERSKVISISGGKFLPKEDEIKHNIKSRYSMFNPNNNLH